MTRHNGAPRAALTSAIVYLLLAGVATADLPGEGPRLIGTDITQQQITDNLVTPYQIRRQGLTVFSTPFNKFDGYGDGPVNPSDTISPGGRPTLQGNGTFLRANGLDAQTCLECHSIVSNATVPAKLGIGGVGGSVTNAIFQPIQLDVSDQAGAGIATFDGRFINPPFLFGSGAVELLGKEMTEDLQQLKQQAQDNPGQVVPLVTKSVSFGTISYDNGAFDYDGVEGIDDDLVVRPFGRKGEFPTVRAFDVGAMMFHLGMQPVEEPSVGLNNDADNDGVVNELTVGEISSLSIFLTTMERPRLGTIGLSELHGFLKFVQVGCDDCHIPALITQSRSLTYNFPEVPTDPTTNGYYSFDLTQQPSGFQAIPGFGIVVPFFADLKRHDMGPGLAESFGSDLDTFFTTARLWGIADTAPYLHDGRATTLGQAILLHGGEAQVQRDAFAALPEPDQADLLRFLMSLRTPTNPAADLLEPEPGSEVEQMVGFVECLSGPASPPTAETALCQHLYDFDFDGDVDLVDYGDVQNAGTQ